MSRASRLRRMCEVETLQIPGAVYAWDVAAFLECHGGDGGRWHCSLTILEALKVHAGNDGQARISKCLLCPRRPQSASVRDRRNGAILEACCPLSNCQVGYMFWHTLLRQSIQGPIANCRVHRVHMVRTTLWTFLEELRLRPLGLPPCPLEEDYLSLKSKLLESRTPQSRPPQPRRTHNSMTGIQNAITLSKIV